MRFIYGLLFVLLTFATGQTVEYCGTIIPQNGCISFNVGAGTGCQWMCNYCSNQLGTTNYYFTDGVCTYETGGCVGNPQAGVTYTCCSN